MQERQTNYVSMDPQWDQKGEYTKKSPELDNTTDRPYHLDFVVRLSSIAAVGGLLFGYDTGVIAGAVLFLHNDFPDITAQQKEVIVSIALVGAALGSFFGGPGADKYGRKAIIYIADIMFTLGAVIMGFASSLGMLILGRFLVGIGVGSAAMVIPVYLAEVSPAKIRGAVVTANNMMITFGQFFAYVVCVFCGENWRMMLGLAALPSFFQFIAMHFLPESPKWLIKNRGHHQAHVIMNTIFKTNNLAAQKEIEYEFKMISESLTSEIGVPFKQRYQQLFTVYKRSLIVGIGVQIWQQLAGINTAMYYGPIILQQSGWGGNSDRTNLINSIPLAAINFLGTCVALLYSDKLGRRWMMLRCLPFLAFFMVGLSFGNYLIYFNNNMETGGLICVLCLGLYLASFSPGMGPQPWTVNSEIYPLHLRGIAMSLSTTANWVANYAISAVFLTTTETNIGKVITYLVIALFCLMAFAFIYHLLPETKGLPLNAVIELFNPDRSLEESDRLNRKEKELMPLNRVEQLDVSVHKQTDDDNIRKRLS